MGVKPKYLHFAHDNHSYFCGAESIEWAEKYLTDDFAKTLPKCPDCLTVYGERYGSDRLMALKQYFEDYKPMESVSVAPTMERVEKLKTLRMYLNT